MKSRIWVPESNDIAQERQRIADEVDAIGQDVLEQAARMAAQASRRTYSPYSHFAVGAAVVDAGGTIHTGQNIETVTFSETGHAEEQAIKNAVSSGAVSVFGRMFIRAVISTAAPCGRCRQIMAEFSDNPLVVILTAQGAIGTVTSLRLLLPLAFTPKDLA